MKTKLLILLSWMFLYATLQTSDGVWQFLTVYTFVLATCSFFYSRENTPKKTKKATPSEDS